MKWAVVLLACFGLPAVAPAETAAPAADDPPDRVLNGHRFVPMRIVDWAFVGTKAGLFLGGGSTGFVQEESNVFEAALFDELEASFLEQRAQLQVQVLDWLAIDALVQTLAVVGTDVPSAVSFGGHASGAFLGGVAVRALRTERLQLGGRVDAGLVTGQGLVPARLIETVEVNEAGEVVFDRPQVAVESSGVIVRPAVSAAYGLGPALGLQASAGYAWRSLDLFGEDRSVQEVDLAIAATLDAREVLLPAALAGAYRLTIPVDPSTAVVHDAELGLYYSGLASLNVGGAVQVALRDVGDALQARTVGWLQMHSFW